MSFPYDQCVRFFCVRYHFLTFVISAPLLQASSSMVYLGFGSTLIACGSHCGAARVSCYVILLVLV